MICISQTFFCFYCGSMAESTDVCSGCERQAETCGGCAEIIWCDYCDGVYLEKEADLFRCADLACGALFHSSCVDNCTNACFTCGTMFCETCTATNLLALPGGKLHCVRNCLGGAPRKNHPSRHQRDMLRKETDPKSRKALNLRASFAKTIGTDLVQKSRKRDRPVAPSRRSISRSPSPVF